MLGCTPSGDEHADNAPKQTAGQIPIVYVVNYPLGYFAERIGGELVEVLFPVPPGEDPAFWEPSAEDVAAFQTADLVLLNGASYAKWVERVSLAQRKLVNTSGGFEDGYIIVEDAITHSHGPGAEHAHTGTAFTTWIDMSQAAEQARAIAESFSGAWPANKDAFDANYAVLEKDLLTLDEEIRSIVGGNRQPMLASHPVYQYFSRRYGISLRSVFWEPEEPPTEPQWAELSRILEGHAAHWMIWEDAPAASSVERLEAMGVGSIVIDPCGNRPEGGDFIGVMKENIENLKRAY
jgi:zinc transport system substrate-binding protein